MQTISLHSTTISKMFCLLLSLLPPPSLAVFSCRGSSGLQNLWGDALTEHTNCRGPEGQQYPHEEVAKMVSRESRRGREGRRGKALLQDPLPFTMDPGTTQKKLLSAYTQARDGGLLSRSKRENIEGCVVGGAPPRLCKSTYNTTAPMYGVSLTSGQPVTIVQKFPDLLQQVIYETCDSSECEVLHGECIQTYVPYLFLVIPLGPVTLTGQDYVLVESGCTCRPKYATPGSDPNPQDIIPNFS